MSDCAVGPEAEGVVVSGDAGRDRLVVGGWGRRVVARVSDAVLMAVLGALGALVASLAVALLAIGSADDFLAGESAGAAGGLAVLWVLLMVLAMLPLYRYEVVPTVRDGQTAAKRAHRLAVVAYGRDDGEGLSRRACRVRFAVPHGAFVAGTTAGLVSTSAWGAWGVVAAAGLGAAGYTAVYASALVDDDRRGWHDKVAGTVVVRTDHRGDPLTAEPGRDGPHSAAAEDDRRGGAPKPIRAAIAALITAAAAATFSAGAYLPLHAAHLVGVDKYDDTIRGTDHFNKQARFGQIFNTDGDGCWPERGGSAYFCDLVSIGGVHFDTGDVQAGDKQNVRLGSGYLCLLDTSAAPWCWEWSDDVLPRPARTPQGEEFAFIMVPEGYRKVEGAPGFVCGQIPDFLRVICWSVGTDHPQYRQASHRFVDGSEWVMRSVGDDPPQFESARRRGFGDEHFDAFTGRELGPIPSDPSVLVTETVP